MVPGAASQALASRHKKKGRPHGGPNGRDRPAVAGLKAIVTCVGRLAVRADVQAFALFFFGTRRPITRSTIL
jgi:hypothetical protein